MEGGLPSRRLWSSTALDTDCRAGEWSVRIVASAQNQPHKAAEYSALRDKHLRFKSDPSSSATAEMARARHSAPHKIATAAPSSEGTVVAKRRLLAQRDAYESVLRNAMSLAALKDPAFLATAGRRKKGDEADQPSAFEVFERAKAKCCALWEELGVEEDRREHIAAQYFTLGAGEEPKADTIEAIHQEIDRSLTLRRLEKEIEYAVRIREGFVYRLYDLAEAASATAEEGGSAAEGQGGGMSLSEVDATLKPLVINTRKATIDVCSAIHQWRQVLGYNAVYMWRGTSYIIKMMSDLHVLAGCEKVMRRFPCRLVDNPLLQPDLPNPKRLLLAGEKAAEKPLMPVRSTLLPPILRPNGQQSDGSVIPPDAQQRAKSLFAAEPAIFEAYMQSTVPHEFSLVDTTTFDAALVRQLARDAVFNEAHAALDVVFAPHHDDGVEDLTPAQRLQISAATIIQSLWRGFVARRRCTALRQQHEAAIRIQRVHRVIAAKQDVSNRRKRHDAAAKIQGLARGVATRAALRQFRAIEANVVRIQTVWRAFAARRYFAYLKALRYCAVIIQRWFRGHLARQVVPRIKSETYNAAATEIQRVWKGGSLRQSKRVNPRAIRAAIIIQCKWRQYIAKTLVATLRRQRRA